jgi:hypothetical protein
MGVGDYIKAAMQRPFEWGVHDCGTFCGQWLGVEIPAYVNAEQAADLIQSHGGLANLYGAAIGDAAQLINEPIAGAVGIIKVGDIEVGGIYSGERWVVFGERGMRAFPHSPAHIESMWHG